MAEFDQFALNPPVSPARILRRHPLHQRGDDVVDRWASGPVRVGPPSAHELAVPAQDRARGDQSVDAQPRGQASDEGCEDCSVRPVQARCRVGAAEHCDFVPQHQQLDILR
jgi:hypothetical protein